MRHRSSGGRLHRLLKIGALPRRSVDFLAVLRSDRSLVLSDGRGGWCCGGCILRCDRRNHILSLRTLLRRRVREQNFFGVRINSEKRKKLHEITATVRPAAVFVSNGVKFLKVFFPNDDNLGVLKPSVRACPGEERVRRHSRARSGPPE